MEKEIVLSDDKPCTVRVLGLFELDNIPMIGDPFGPFYEEIEMGGKTIKRKYIPPTFPPEKPDTPKNKVAKNSREWHAWLEWELYFAYLSHRREEAEIMGKYHEDVKTHIMAECVKEEDWLRIVVKEDWRKIHRATLSARLNREELAQALANTFPGDV